MHELDTVTIESDVVGMLAALLCVKMFVYLQLALAFCLLQKQ